MQNQLAPELTPGTAPAAASFYLLGRSVGVAGEQRDYRQFRNGGPGQAGLGALLLSTMGTMWARNTRGYVRQVGKTS